mgnify:CR=1 FL=1
MRSNRFGSPSSMRTKSLRPLSREMLEETKHYKNLIEHGYSAAVALADTRAEIRSNPSLA